VRRLIENLEGRNDNYILPFLWIHGEDEGVLRGKVRRIHKDGIRALCVEARPHHDFNGEGWFADLATILDECKQLGMRMWLLDDSHFPTGFANGEAQRNHPELCKQFLRLKTFDLVGPIENSGVFLNHVLCDDRDVLLGAFLQRRLGFEEVDPSETLDVTDTLHYVEDYFTGGPKHNRAGHEQPGIQGACPVVSFDLPAGHWCLNVMVVSYRGGEKQTEGYLNPLIPEATEVLLNTVYQPVFDRFREFLGTTFAGFFSDEPRLGNWHGAEDASIGRNSSMDLPWRPGMTELMLAHCKALGGRLAELNVQQLKARLPLLFFGSNDSAHELRFAYMDLISKLYSTNFDGRIARWCHDHSCEHIGHTIEDNGAAARLGYGSGHIFRAMAHADMAGIDVVMHQLSPGKGQGLYKAIHKPGWDGEFFFWMLAAFGGSMAHLDPVKRGRCMCELFGAYGWAEGTRLQKWILDHMLVRGVNTLVPHAYNCKAFPDFDCPPHFGEDAFDPQTPEFSLLMAYANRMCHLLNGGVACPDIALYYNAEGEWSGDYLPTQRVAAELGSSSISYDLVSADLLAHADVSCGMVTINGVSFHALLVPWAEALPSALLSDLVRLHQDGAKVLFVGNAPSRTSQGVDLPASLHAMSTIAVEQVTQKLAQTGLLRLSYTKQESNLRTYRYRHDDGEVFFFTNEGMTGRVVTTVQGAANGKAYVYDPFCNAIIRDDNAFDLDIPAGGSKVVVVANEDIIANDVLSERPSFNSDEYVPLERCDVFVSPFGTGVFKYACTLKHPDYLSKQPAYESFSGRIRYVFDAQLSSKQCDALTVIELDGVCEGASVSVNGVGCGTRICPDYTFQLKGLHAGENQVVVELNTTLARSLHDYLSMYLPLEPSGLRGAILR